ncbi:MAG: DUF616 domain-containing protein [Bacilli bacterium]|nr:DUF616 domain-containing protein [Bacilli bacterium]
MKKNNKICVYTCITGNYDDLHELEIKEKNVDYICFTNNKNIKSDTWKIIYIENDKLDNHRLSRKIKMLGHPYISENYNISVWMDAGVVFKKKVTDFVKMYLKDNSFASFKHSSRNCIYEEANECIKLRKDSKENVLKILEFLKKEKYPKNNGLYEMTVFIKKHNDPIVIKTMNLWFDIVCKYSKRDQLSFMYCVWKTGMKIDDINLNVWDNEWFTNIKHNFKTEIKNTRVYFGDEEINFDINLNEEIDYKNNKNVYSFNTKVLCDTNVIKIEVTNVPLIRYSNLNIKGITFDKMTILNTIKYNNDDIFYNAFGIIYLYGNFKKGQKLNFSIELNKLSEIEKIDFIEYLNVNLINTEVRLKHFEELYNSLDKDNKILRERIQNIYNSKFWKLSKPLRYIRRKLKRQ